MFKQEIDVCVIGAGVGGIACAQGLARQGMSVVLLDRLHPMPDCLKAEKIGGEGVPPLLRLGFQAAVETALTPLYNVAVFFSQRRLGRLRLDPPEAGALYHVLVNSLREHLDPNVDFRPGTKALAFEQQSNKVEVVTDKGPSIPCRLAVIATGDAHQLLEPLGGVYEPQMPHKTFVAAFDLEGPLRDKGGPVDTLTFHHPISGSPIAYATFFRLGRALRANIFSPGPITESWQHDLKQRPLEVLAEHNRLLAHAAREWQVTSPVMIRKVHVARLRPPASPRVAVLGDAAHTIDPSGGGGLTFLLLEAELLLNLFAPRWLKSDDCSAEAISTFYQDPRRISAVQHFFGRGNYIYSLNHDESARGHLRRLRFALNHTAASRVANRVSGPSRSDSEPWNLPAPYLYEQYT